MATKKADETVRLDHINGASVTVTEDKVDRLLAGGLFTKAAARRTAKSASADE